MPACLWIAVLVVLAVVASASPLAPVHGTAKPGRLYMWSWGDSNPAFSTHFITKSTTVDQAINHVVDVMQDYEVVVLLTPDAEQTHESCPFVQQSIQHAPSAQIMHNVYPSQSHVQLGQSLSTAMARPASSQQATFQRKPLVEIEELLEKSPQMLKDGKADVFVAPVSSKQDVVEFSLTSRVLLEKHHKVLFVSYDEVKALPQAETKRSLSQGGYSRLLTVSSDVSDGVNYKPEGGEYAIYYQAKYLYITPDIFTGLMTFLFVTFAVTIGLSCLGSIQGMSSFYDKLPAVGKEA